MSDTPDSLLNAAKALAKAADLPWPYVQKYYRALQQEQTSPDGPTPWLPKSFGRSVWHAHPHFVARLIVALAAAPDPSQAREAVSWTRSLTRSGRALMMTEGDAPGLENPFEKRISSLLIEPGEAAKIASVEFLRDVHIVVFRHVDGSRERWAPADEQKLPMPEVGLIRSHGVVDGQLFATLGPSVCWRDTTQPPFGNASEDAD